MNRIISIKYGSRLSFLNISFCMPYKLYDVTSNIPEHENKVSLRKWLELTRLSGDLFIIQSGYPRIIHDVEIPNYAVVKGTESFRQNKFLGLVSQYRHWMSAIASLTNCFFIQFHFEQLAQVNSALLDSNLVIIQSGYLTYLFIRSWSLI